MSRYEAVPHPHDPKLVYYRKVKDGGEPRVVPVKRPPRKNADGVVPAKRPKGEKRVVPVYRPAHPGKVVPVVRKKTVRNYPTGEYNPFDTISTANMSLFRRGIHFPNYYYGFVGESYLDIYTKRDGRGTRFNFIFSDGVVRSKYFTLERYGLSQDTEYCRVYFYQDGKTRNLEEIPWPDTQMATDLLDHISIGVEDGRELRIKRVQIVLNDIVICNTLFASPYYRLTTNKPLDLSDEIRQERLRILSQYTSSKNKILQVAALEIGKSWHPKYGGYWRCYRVWIPDQVEAQDPETISLHHLHEPVDYNELSLVDHRQPVDYHSLSLQQKAVVPMDELRLGGVPVENPHLIDFGEKPCQWCSEFSSWAIRQATNLDTPQLTRWGKRHNDEFYPEFLIYKKGFQSWDMARYFIGRGFSTKVKSRKRNRFITPNTITTLWDYDREIQGNVDEKYLKYDFVGEIVPSIFSDEYNNARGWTGNNRVILTWRERNPAFCSYTHLPQKVKPGFYVKLKRGLNSASGLEDEEISGHSTLFVGWTHWNSGNGNNGKWEEGFRAANSFNYFWGLGGNQNGGRVTIDRYSISKNSSSADIYWKASPSATGYYGYQDGFGDTSDLPGRLAGVTLKHR